jgi:hypothetical protein
MDLYAGTEDTNVNASVLCTAIQVTRVNGFTTCVDKTLFNALEKALKSLRIQVVGVLGISGSLQDHVFTQLVGGKGSSQC